MSVGLNNGIDWVMENKCAVLPEANKPTSHQTGRAREREREREREGERERKLNQNNEQRQNNTG